MVYIRYGSLSVRYGSLSDCADAILCHSIIHKITQYIPVQYTIDWNRSSYYPNNRCVMNNQIKNSHNKWLYFKYYRKHYVINLLYTQLYDMDFDLTTS